MKKEERDQKGFTGAVEHLDMLLFAIKKNDPGIWNNWRKKNPGLKIRLNGANIRNAECTGADFSSVDLTDADLSQTKLQNADLTGAVLNRATLGEAILVNATLKKAVLHGAYLHKADLSGAQCQEADFNTTILSEANCREANLDFAIMRATDATRSDFCYSSLKHVTLEQVTLTGAYFHACAIKEWRAAHLKCDYIYIDEAGEERLPHNRNFRPGEFEGYIMNLQPPKTTVIRKPPEGRKFAHVYLSHAPADREYIVRLADALELNAVRVWKERERLQPGVSWQEAISAAIDNGAFFIACFSKNYPAIPKSATSQEFEIALARLKNITADREWFLPVKISHCDIPDIDCGAGKKLIDLPWIDLTEGWNDGVKKIAAAITAKKY